MKSGVANPWGGVEVETFRPPTLLDRTWAGFDGEAVVATLRSFPAQLTVPGGGALEVSAVSAVTPEGASCARTTASAELTVDVAVLGSIYLGGYGLRWLAAGGLADEAAPGALGKADAMFRSPIAPWCSTGF